MLLVIRVGNLLQDSGIRIKPALPWTSGPDTYLRPSEIHFCVLFKCSISKFLATLPQGLLNIRIIDSRTENRIVRHKEILVSCEVALIQHHINGGFPNGYFCSVTLRSRPETELRAPVGHGGNGCRSYHARDAHHNVRNPSLKLLRKRIGDEIPRLRAPEHLFFVFYPPILGKLNLLLILPLGFLLFFSGIPRG